MQQDFEVAVDAAETTEALWTAFGDYFHGSAVKRLTYLHLPPLGALDDRRPDMKSHGLPDEAIEQYLAGRHYRDNPILQRAQRSAEPVYWDEIDDMVLSANEKYFVEEFQKVGLRYGVGIPAHGPDGRRGQFGLGFGGDVRRLDRAVLADYRWVCQLTHLRYCALILPTLGPLPELSNRETEVLAWVARGKSNGTIGQILGISANTVDAHLRRIYLKLGVFDRISAAVRGIGVGLIHAETGLTA